MSRIAKMVATKSKTLRKGEVFTFLAQEQGFTMANTVIWVKGYGYGLITDGIDGGALFASLDAATASFNTVKAEIAKGLPTPEVGAKAITKVKKPQVWTGHNPWYLEEMKAKHNTDAFYAYEVEAVDGVEAIALTSPEGKTFNFYAENPKHGLTALLKWLHEETNVGAACIASTAKAEAAKVEKAQADKATKNIKTCPCCFGEYVAKPGMVHHGYTRPGDGQIHGDCFGVNYLPYEESCEGTVALKNVLVSRMEGAKTRLEVLQAGLVSELVVQTKDWAAWHKYGQRKYTTETITTGDHRWGEALQVEIAKTKSRILRYESDIEFLVGKIETWAVV